MDKMRHKWNNMSNSHHNNYNSPRTVSTGFILDKKLSYCIIHPLFGKL